MTASPITFASKVFDVHFMDGTSHEFAADDLAFSDKAAKGFNDPCAILPAEYIMFTRLNQVEAFVNARNVKFITVDRNRGYEIRPVKRSAKKNPPKPQGAKK